jgi:hypothetical protein
MKNVICWIATYLFGNILFLILAVFLDKYHTIPIYSPVMLIILCFIIKVFVDFLIFNNFYDFDK